MTEPATEVVHYSLGFEDRLWLILTLLAVVLLTVVSSVWYSRVDHRLDRIQRGVCTWGASSTSATIRNGKVTVVPPQTTGCVKP